MSMTPEAIEKAKKAHAAMRADPTFLDASIAKLSAEAQIPAKAMREILFNGGGDVDAMRAKIAAIRAPLSAPVLAELDAHRDRITEKYGLPKCQ